MPSLYAFLVMLLVNSIWAAPPPAKHHPPFLLSTSPFIFSEAAISTQPGEVIQICVDKQGGLQTFNNTIVVEVLGNKLPHLSNFSEQSLSFPWGTTQACFNLTVGSDQSSLAYTLGIRGSTEELEIDVIHKVTGICGVITKPVNTPSPSSSAASVDFWDRFGNAYAYEELLFNFGGMECMDSGDFALEFSPGFSPDEITTICSVFNYLSTLIDPAATDIPILILKETLTGSTLAAGTEYYRADSGGGCGIENSTIWEFINTDIYANGVFQNEIIVGRIDIDDMTPWHTLNMDGPTAPDVDANSFDLYSVVLHEALHILGFASRITVDGSPLNGFYTAWDRELIMGTDAMGYPVPALTPVASAQCCNAHAYNTALSAPEPAAFSCSNRFEFPFGPGTQKATVWGEYGPLTMFPSPNSRVINVLSHLNSGCDLVDYVMVAEFNAGITNRSVTAEEQGILCQLGCQIINGGTLACSNACTVVAVNDFVFIPFEEVQIVSGGGYSVEIDYSALTANDFFPAGASVNVYACDPVVNVIIANNNPVAEKFTVSGFVSGQAFTLCYSASGCDGVCDDAIVNVVIELSADQIINSSGPGCGEQENIVGWGTFEEFTVFEDDNA